MAGTLELSTDEGQLRYEPLVLVAVAVAAGIVVDRYAPQSRGIWCGFGALFLVGWMCLPRGASAVASACALIATACLAAACHHASWHELARDHLFLHASEEQQPIAVEAIVRETPRILPAPASTPLRPFPIGDRSRCDVDIVRVRNGSTWQASQGRCSFQVDGHLLGIQAGDRVRILGIFSRPQPRLNPGEFDFAEFERSSGRLLGMRAEMPDCITLLERGSFWNVGRWVEQLRAGGEWQLRRFISNNRAPLAAAIMLGVREYVDAERNERFLVTGTVHLLAISGVNLAILASGIWLAGACGFLSRRTTLACAIVFAAGYAVLTDAQPPVVRAAVLIIVWAVGRWIGRPVSPWHVLAMAAIIVLAINPAWLFHVGAQLSFLAVAVLAYFREPLAMREPSDPLDRLIWRTRPLYVRVARSAWLVLWQVILSGFLVWLFSLPLVWLRYNLISPVSLGLNPVVWLPMSLVLFSGFFVLVGGWLSPSLATLAGSICDASLAFMETSIAWSERITGGYYYLPAPPLWWVIVFYVVVACLMLEPVRRLLRIGGIIALGVAWCVVAIPLAMPWSASDLSSQGELRATFISVGHGTSILLELPERRTILYDCGRMGSPQSGARPIAAVLWSRGITRIDAAVISHADSDHFNALPELLERFEVGQLFLSNAMEHQFSPALAKLNQSIEQAKLRVTRVQAGDTIRVRSPFTKLSVLHPPRGGVLGSDNANSIVLLIEYAGRRLMLTGDLEDRGLADLLREEPIDCDVVLAPHHGSTRSNPGGFAAWCQAEHVVISGGHSYEQGRSYLQVARAYQREGATVYHTALQGAIRFEIRATGVAAKQYRASVE